MARPGLEPGHHDFQTDDRSTRTPVKTLQFAQF
jgi:hypothetical protein